jgi:hypothetical protein
MMWEWEETLTNEINEVWSSSDPMTNLDDISGSLRRVMNRLKVWSNGKFGVVTKEIGKLRKKLENLEAQGPQADHAELLNTRIQMDELLEREELMWFQRSRISWLREGDHNTKYFHRKAAHRSKKNKIKMLRTEDGQTMRNRVEMEGMVQEFFKNLYTTDSNVSPDDLIQNFDQRISDDDNQDLCKEFTDDEISAALFQIRPLKVPRPDDSWRDFFKEIGYLGSWTSSGV